MRWLLLLLASVAAQPAMPLLPSGVTMSMVTRIDVEAPGAKVALIQEDDGVEATITNRLSYAPVIKFDHATGTLTVTAVPASSSSMLKPGMFAAFVAVALCAFQSKGKNSPFVLLLLLGLGVANATLIVDDLILRIPGCWHPENNGTSVIFDQQCQNSTMSSFQAPAVPEATVSSGAEWKPVNPAIDSPKHTMSEDFQYEVWRSMYGKEATNATRDAFYAFTRECQRLNALPDRTWLAACNQFAGMTPEDWKATILGNNSALLEEFHNSPQGRRLLETAEYSDVAENRRRLLQTPTSFSWVGTGKLTPVKDQGNCGSCYAHSTSSQMEAQTAIEKGTVPVVLSREQLKSCSSGAPGCNGGVPAYMYNYAKTGLGTEAALPYKAVNTACPGTKPATVYSNTGYVSIANNEIAFKTAVQKAPVAVTVCADTWSNYAGGVFKNCQTGCSVNHAVLLVGYGTDATLGPYWLIQNSWNTWWGEAGFIRLARTDSSTAGVGMCGLTAWTGQQASGITANGGGSTGTACQGSWSAWSSCTKTCGGGTQSRTWTTTAQPTGNGAACPNPTTQSQTCNTNLCSGTGGTTSCLRLSGTVLGSTGDGDYKSVTGWSQGFCGTGLNPQYLSKDGKNALFFFVTNCVNNVRTAGVWGFGPSSIPRAGYQWAGKQTISNGVIPAPNTATGWTISISAGTTCV